MGSKIFTMNNICSCKPDRFQQEALHMKKGLFVTIILLIVMAVFCAYAESDHSGTWYAVKFVKAGQESDAKENGYNQVLAFYPSEEAIIMREGGRYQEGKWSDLERYVIVHFQNAQSLLFSIEGDFLTQMIDGGTLWFKKETTLQETSDIFPNSEEAFYGIWVLDRLSNNGKMLSLHMASLSGTDIKGKITIAKDSSYLEIDLGNKPVTWDGQPTYSNGKIYFGNAEFAMTDTEELYLTVENTKYFFRKLKPEEGWFCSLCGNLANGNFCSNCGQAHQISEEKNSLETLLGNDETPKPKEKMLYRGDYVAGSDLPTGVYVLSASELEYDWLWEVNKASIRTYEYIKAERDWVKKDYQSVNKRGQKIRITLEAGQKFTVESGSFEIVEFTYRAPEDTEQADQEETSPEYVPWFDYGVGSKLPRPIAVSGKVLKASSLATTNGDESFYTTVSANKKDYLKYKEALRTWGFVEDVSEVDTAYTASYSAKNNEGYEISITYNSFTGIIVSASAPDTAPASDKKE